MDDRIDLEALIGEYRAEARQQLDLLDRGLLTIEEKGEIPGEERSELLRVLHTLKGNSAMLGLKPIADQVHAIENVFKEMSAGTAPIALDPLFELSATIRSAVDRLGSSEEEAALARVAEFDLRASGGDLRGVTRAAATDAGAGDASGTRAPAVIVARGSGAGVAEAVAPLAAGEPVRGVPASSAEVLRVPFEKLDALLARVGELVMLHSRLEALVDGFREQLQEVGMHRELEERVEDLEALATSLQDTTMDLRLVPLRVVLGRFPALVRELARGQGKRARLVLEGDDIGLDKSAVDALGEPLLHLIRNAVDHGLEAPEARGAAGKDPVGTVSIRAKREGDHIQIALSDDGAGLDHAAILRRAREVGLVGAADNVSPAEIREMLFAPGFSTRAEATTISGRGLGLDIVRESVARLRGSIDLTASGDTGVTFTLLLPLTLAIVPALIFEVDGEVLALAASDVEETLPRSVPERVGGAEVVRRGSSVLPIALPERIFGWGEGVESRRSGRARFAIVLRRGARAAAVPADRLIDQRSVIVKALPPLLGSVRGVSGATITADGRVVLLLDSQAVLDLNLDAQRRQLRAT